jgi:hypothetical protein
MAASSAPDSSVHAFVQYGRVSDVQLPLTGFTGNRAKMAASLLTLSKQVIDVSGLLSSLVELMLPRHACKRPRHSRKRRSRKTLIKEARDTTRLCLETLLTVLSVSQHVRSCSAVSLCKCHASSRVQCESMQDPGKLGVVYLCVPHACLTYTSTRAPHAWSTRSSGSCLRFPSRET